MLPPLIIRSSYIHAPGCYTTRRIPEGARVCEYNGPRLSKSEADRRYQDRTVTYLFSFGTQGSVIDGFGAAMFINHSCAPNCETLEENERIFILALRNIEPGEELTSEYHLHDSDDTDGTCHCGAPQCRGTMFSRAEVKRRLRRAARGTKTTEQKANP